MTKKISKTRAAVLFLGAAGAVSALTLMELRDLQDKNDPFKIDRTREPTEIQQVQESPDEGMPLEYLDHTR